MSCRVSLRQAAASAPRGRRTLQAFMRASAVNTMRDGITVSGRYNNGVFASTSINPTWLVKCASWSRRRMRRWTRRRTGSDPDAVRNESVPGICGLEYPELCARREHVERQSRRHHTHVVQPRTIDRQLRRTHYQKQNFFLCAVQRAAHVLPSKHRDSRAHRASARRLFPILSRRR